MFGRRRRAVDEGGTIVVRVPPGEHVTLRIEAEALTVQGDAEQMARSLGIRFGERGSIRPRPPLDQGAGAGAFVAGAAVEEAADDSDDD